MSLIDSARDFMKGLVPAGPEVGVHETAEEPGHAAVVPGDAVDDEIERTRREWDSEPSHH